MRDFNYDISPQIKQRWSPRAFSTEALAAEEIMPLLEAARYAPSCYNDQPWRFVVAVEQKDLTVMQSVLAPANQVWANTAPVLIAIVAKETFSFNDKPNYWHAFDCGTAWGFLALEAERRGLITHAMGGFDRAKAKEVLNIPDSYAVIAIVAVGKLGNADSLPDDLKEREQPGTRYPLADIVSFGRFSGK